MFRLRSERKTEASAVEEGRRPLLQSIGDDNDDESNGDQVVSFLMSHRKDQV